MLLTGCIGGWGGLTSYFFHLMNNTINYSLTVYVATLLFGMTLPVVLMATALHLVNSGENANT